MNFRTHDTWMCQEGQEAGGSHQPGVIARATQNRQCCASVSEPPSGVQLPAGWVSLMDPRFGVAYYSHLPSGHSQWELPSHNNSSADSTFQGVLSGIRSSPFKDAQILSAASVDASATAAPSVEAQTRAKIEGSSTTAADEPDAANSSLALLAGYGSDESEGA